MPYFIGISDRGPNIDCEDTGLGGLSGKGFPVSQFSPSLFKFTLEESLDIKGTAYLSDSTGKYVSGISNTDADDTPYEKDCVTPLDYDQNGQDVEAIVTVKGPDGKMYFAIVDEYSPSISFLYSDGTVVHRYIPEDQSLPDSTYPVSSILPSIYSNRRKNRGLEALACNQKYVGGKEEEIDGYKCWAFLQSPIAQDSYVHRVIELDFSNGVDLATVTAEYVFEGTPTPTSFYGTVNPDSIWIESANKPKDLKVSGAFYTQKNKIAVLE